MSTEADNGICSVTGRKVWKCSHCKREAVRQEAEQQERSKPPFLAMKTLVDDELARLGGKLADKAMKKALGIQPDALDPGCTRKFHFDIERLGDKHAGSLVPMGGTWLVPEGPYPVPKQLLPRDVWNWVLLIGVYLPHTREYKLVFKNGQHPTYMEKFIVPLEWVDRWHETQCGTVPIRPDMLPRWHRDKDVDWWERTNSHVEIGFKDGSVTAIERELCHKTASPIYRSWFRLHAPYEPQSVLDEITKRTDVRAAMEASMPTPRGLAVKELKEYRLHGLECERRQVHHRVDITLTYKGAIDAFRQLRRSFRGLGEVLEGEPGDGVLFVPEGQTVEVEGNCTIQLGKKVLHVRREGSKLLLLDKDYRKLC